MSGQGKAGTSRRLNVKKGCDCGPEPDRDGTEDYEKVEVPCGDDDPGCGKCTWLWNPSNQDWEVVEDGCLSGCEGCGSGPTDAPANPDQAIERTWPCDEEPPDDCGFCIWEWDGTQFLRQAGGDRCGGACDCGDAPEPGQGQGQPIGYTVEKSCIPGGDCKCRPNCDAGWGAESVIRSSIVHKVIRPDPFNDEIVYTYKEDQPGTVNGCGCLVVMESAGQTDFVGRIEYQNPGGWNVGMNGTVGWGGDGSDLSCEGPRNC